jgi:uncharacterized delta-60 repeat protein
MSRSMSISNKVIGRSHRSVIFAVVVGLSLLVGLWQTWRLVQAADGDLDPTFGTGGKVTTTFPGGLDTANDVAVQSDGKIVVAGWAGTDFALTRYNTDGTLDATFGAGGRVNTDFPNGLGGTAEAMIIQPDGKIVLAGTAQESATSFNSVFALARYNTNGSLDTTFDGDGRVTTPFPNASATARALAIQPDGKLVTAGISTDSTTFNNAFALARYNTDGSLDASFDGDGRVTTDIPGLTFEEAHAVAIQSNGRIVVAGLGSGAFVLTRYNTNGSLDSGAGSDLTPGDSFGTGGIVTTAFGGTFEEANALAIQADGKIVAAGQTATSVAADMNFALARYNTDGSLDSGAAGDLTPGDSFGTGGKVITDFGLVDAARDVEIQADGKIIAVGGAGTTPGGSFFALARYNTNGSPDNSFDTDGKVLTDFSGGRFSLGALGVTLQTDGRIVAVGDANITGQRDFGVARYNTDGSLDSGAAGDLTPGDSFGTGGKVITDFLLNDDAVTALLLQSDGKIIAAGRNQLKIRISQAQDPNFQLARYNANGTLDATFGAGGIVQTDFASNGDDFANDAALQTDGKIVVVGQTGAHFSQIPSADTFFGIARYNTNGSLDTTFDTDGKVTTDFGTTHDAAFAVAIQTDGKIVVAGTNGSDFILARYNTNGSLDTTFDTDGKVTTDFNATFDSARALVIQANGKIVAAGSSGSDFALARYNTDGSLDSGAAGDLTPGDSFGTGGKVTTDFSGASDSINKLALQSDGKHVAAGSATTTGGPAGADFALARYNTDGSPDNTFDGDGKTTTDFGGSDQANGIALQSDGRIVAAGVYFVTPAAPGPSAFFAVARYNTNGQLDNTFGTGGKVTTDFFGVDNQANAVLIQPDQRILAGGYTDTGSSRDFALARYLSTTVPPPPATTVQFSQASYSVQEDCTALPVTVTRTGDTSGTTTVKYQTFDGTASQAQDYNLALGRLTFAPGESAKTIFILINEDSKVEGTENFTISLSTPSSGASIGTPATATIQVTDDVPETSGNALDDTAVFVCQHYHDFLNRQPEPGGFQGWQNTLNTCPQSGKDGNGNFCDRIEVSSAFFRSQEFQVRGYFLYRFYSVSFGRVPRYMEFMADLSLTTGFLTDQQVEAGKQAFISEFMTRPEFKNKYDSITDPTNYVNALLSTAGVTISNKQQLIDDLAQGKKDRAEVLRAIVESPEVTAKFYKEAFVVEEYFGYLRRDPDILYLEWIKTFEQTNDYRVLVGGFMNSTEYRHRFEP